MPSKLSKKIEREIIRLHKKGIGTTKTAKILGISPSATQLYLKKNNLIPLGITHPYKNKYDINFFSKYTKESAYWAGFIMADGCITNKSPLYNIQITLSINDKNHLQKFAKIVDFKGSLYEYKKGNSVVIRLSGKQVINDLLDKYGITERKSLTAQFPKNLPKSLCSHFIRGYFDGDGCIYVGNSVSISFVGNKNIIKSIRDILHETLKLEIQSNNNKAPFINTKNEKIKQFSYHAKNAKKIIQWLYNDTNKSIRLDRKYKKCIKEINLR